MKNKQPKVHVTLPKERGAAQPAVKKPKVVINTFDLITNDVIPQEVIVTLRSGSMPLTTDKNCNIGLFELAYAHANAKIVVLDREANKVMLLVPYVVDNIKGFDNLDNYEYIMQEYAENKVYQRFAFHVASFPIEVTVGHIMSVKSNRVSVVENKDCEPVEISNDELFIAAKAYAKKFYHH